MKSKPTTTVSRKFLSNPNITVGDIQALLDQGCYHAVKHPNATAEQCKQLQNSTKWYIRLVGFCVKKYRKQFFEKAIQDPKSTVRKAAYLGALRGQSSEDTYFTGWLAPDDLRAIILSDTRVHGYFRHGVWRWFSDPQTDLSWDAYFDALS